MEYMIGWNHDENGWWYADTKTSYYKSCWQVINGHKYYFNPDGYAVKDWQEIGGKWYYFEPREGMIWNVRCTSRMQMEYRRRLNLGLSEILLNLFGNDTNCFE